MKNAVAATAVGGLIGVKRGFDNGELEPLRIKLSAQQVHSLGLYGLTQLVECSVE
jgi:hypothetical protein